MAQAEAKKISFLCYKIRRCDKINNFSRRKAGPHKNIDKMASNGIASLDLADGQIKRQKTSVDYLISFSLTHPEARSLYRASDKIKDFIG